MHAPVTAQTTLLHDNKIHECFLCLLLIACLAMQQCTFTSGTDTRCRFGCHRVWHNASVKQMVQDHSVFKSYTQSLINRRSTFIKIIILALLFDGNLPINSKTIATKLYMNRQIQERAMLKYIIHQNALYPFFNQHFLERSPNLIVTIFHATPASQRLQCMTLPSDSANDPSGSASLSCISRTLCRITS